MNKAIYSHAARVHRVVIIRYSRRRERRIAPVQHVLRRRMRISIIVWTARLGIKYLISSVARNLAELANYLVTTIHRALSVRGAEFALAHRVCRVDSDDSAATARYFLRSRLKWN